MAILLAMVFASVAAAQDEPTARSLFEEGRAALEAGDPALAEEKYRASLALESRASTAYMLALVLQERSSVREAVALYDRVLGGELGELPPSIDRAAVQELRDRAERDLAVLTVTVRGAGELRVDLDGEIVGSLRPGTELTLRVDPGRHTLAGSAGDRTSPLADVDVARGERRAVEIALPELDPAPIVRAAPAPALVSASEIDEDEGGSAWPWILGGVGVALIAGVTIAIVFATYDSGYSAEPWSSVTALTTP